MTVVITGASSFLGKSLIKRFSESGESILALSRKKPAWQDVLWTPWSLTAPLDIPRHLTVKCVIHLAHDYRENEGVELSIEGTKQVFEYFANHGAKLQIYISSYSAGLHAISTYGKIKFELEQFFSTQESAMIIRPGLILGNGGLHGRMTSWVDRYHFAVLPDGGHGQIPVILLERITEIIHDASQQKFEDKYYNAFEPTLLSLRNLVMEQRSEGKRILIISVPSKIMYLTLKLLSTLGFKLPVTHDNLQGFIQNQSSNMVSSLPSPLEKQ